MKKKLFFYSFVAAVSLFVIIHATIDLVWFNITEQSINELAITKEATQLVACPSRGLRKQLFWVWLHP